MARASYKKKQGGDMNESTGASRKGLKVSTRLALGFGGVTALALAIALMSAWQQRELAHRLDEIANQRMADIEKGARLKDNLNAIAISARNKLLTNDAAIEQAESERISRLRADSTQLLEALDKNAVDAKVRAQLKAILTVRPGYLRGLDRALQLNAEGKSGEAASLLLGAVRDQQVIMFQSVDESNARQRAMAAAEARDTNESAQRNAFLMLMMAFAVAAIGIGMTWLLARNLARTLGAEPADLSAAARRVAAGDLGHSHESGLSLAPSGSVMASLSDMRQSLARIVTQVRASSENIATGSAQIATGNADLSQRTEEQAGALQQTAATMEELGSTVRGNADSARQAAELAQGASSLAAQGGEAVSKVVHTIQRLSESSRRIGDITGVIDAIAFQTNILALNAAVEAARAGEQGRGFAVVASEVRMLAQRSAEAAKEIKTLIGHNLEQVEQGCSLADEAGRTMQDVVGSSRRVSDIVTEITTATLEQSDGVQQVGIAVTQMDQVTQQNAALVEESAAAADSLKAQAQQLVHMVSVFRLA
jgi:methyl-accepting chemotaxis protein